MKKDILDNDIDLVAEWKKTKDNKFLEKIIANHYNMIYSITKKYKNLGLNYEDLVLEGVTGLIIALGKFKPEKQIKFSTYAFFWIKAKVLNFITKMKKKIKAPAFSYENNIKNSENHNLFENVLISMDTFINPEHNNNKFIEFYENLELTSKNKTIDSETEKNLSEIINLTMLCLPYRESYILQHRWINEKKQTVAEIALKLKISPERVRQIEKEAFKNLYVLISEQFGDIRGAIYFELFMLDFAQQILY